MRVTIGCDHLPKAAANGLSVGTKDHRNQEAECDKAKLKSPLAPQTPKETMAQTGELISPAEASKLAREQMVRFG
jgi:hypothetical protein